MEGEENIAKKRKIQISHSESCEKEENDEKECNSNWIGGEIIVGAYDIILGIEDELIQELNSLSFGLPVAYVYNPLVYAWELHKQYVRNYGGRRVEVLLVGMNPGPFGMAQTGVPFGDSTIVRDFLKINGKVDSPRVTHPKRQIYGLDCPRREISGQRLWGWAEKQFQSAEKFLQRFWIHNYCPLLFMEASSKNRTPDKLPANERESLEASCNKALIATINLIQPRLVVGVGSTMFLNFFDASSHVKNATYLCELIEKVSNEVGEDDNVQVVIDNARNYVAASRVLMERHPTICLSPFASNFLNLILEDIGKIEWVKTCVDRE